MVQCDTNKKKIVQGGGPCLAPRQRASTLGVITELPPPGQDGKKSSNGVEEGGPGVRPEHGRPSGQYRARSLSGASSTSSLSGGDVLPVVAGM